MDVLSITCSVGGAKVRCSGGSENHRKAMITNIKTKTPSPINDTSQPKKLPTYSASSSICHLLFFFVIPFKPTITFVIQPLNQNFVSFTRGIAMILYLQLAYLHARYAKVLALKAFIRSKSIKL